MAAQADACSITLLESRPKSPTQSIREFVASFRKFISPRVFQDRPSQTLVFPIPNDGWFPVFKCGEFAIIDSSVTQYQEGQFYLWRSLSSGASSGLMSIVRLKKHGAGMDRLTGRNSRGVHWWMKHPAQIVRHVDGSPCDDLGIGGRVHFNDGPLPEKFMRECILGQVAGVLGRGAGPAEMQTTSGIGEDDIDEGAL